MNNNESFSTPILLTVWRRSKETKEVIESLRKVKPKKLFIACDGPREGNEKESEKVKQTIKLCKEEIDWDCDLKWLISNKNLGCKLGVSSAINWFFENVNEGIFLEDDNVAHPDFFPYCEELLSKYRNDKRVWCISGTNNQGENVRGKGSYYFGKIPLVWGWATWKDRWDEYDLDMKKWPEINSNSKLDDIFRDPIEKEYWMNIFENYYKNKEPDTWDYQWVFTCLINNGLVVIPNKNLINNIGFNLDATHTKWEKLIPSKVSSIGDKIIHPEFMICDSKAERYQFDYYFGGYNTRLRKNIFMRIKNKLNRTFKIKR